MTSSVTDIYNKALQILGATRVSAPTDNSRAARACNACYAMLRDALLSKHPWIFATKRVILAPDTATPPFDYLYQFTLPPDCLTIRPQNDPFLDWMPEGRQILSNASNTLKLRYTAQITDTSLFDPNFVRALAADMAEEMCEELTQSNEKKAYCKDKKKEAIAEAVRNNAFEKLSDDPPDDSWVTARGASASAPVGTWANPDNNN